MVLLHFPQNLMDRLKGWNSLQGLTVMFILLSVVSKGSACEAPSSPQCFRRHSDETVYRCEWSMNTSAIDVTYDLHFNTTDPPFKETEFEGIDQTWTTPLEEDFPIKDRAAYIWVTARRGGSSCSSPRTSVVLSRTVKYEAPQNLQVSWSESSLSLQWRAVETQPALVEVLFRRKEDITEPWQSRSLRTNTPNETLIYGVSVANLQKHSAYQVRVRQKSTKVLNPLWSDWSAVHTAPAKLELSPEVKMATREFENGTRIVMLTWKPVPHAAAVGGVTYSLTDTQSFHECPCPRKKKKKKHINTSKTEYRTYVTNSLVNITLNAFNAAGASPSANILVPAKTAKGLTTCKKLSPKKVPKKACFEWYEVEDGKVRPDTVITLRAKEHYHNITTKLKDFVPYVYFQHECVNTIPRTVEMCLFYKKEGVPRSKPQEFIASSDSHSSAGLSWKAIPSEDHQGFLTHYVVCSMKISPEHGNEECHNVSASHTQYRLEDLIPGARYNISLAGVTRVGAGPRASLIFNTMSKKSVDVWFGIGLPVVFFFISIGFTFIFKRLKHKILPPVPKPVIRDTANNQQVNQEMLEITEEVDDLTLHQLQPETKPEQTTEDLEDTAFLDGVGETDDTTDDEVEDERILEDSMTPEESCDECLSPGYKHQALMSYRDLD
ncbi:uncharacterized protein il12rb1 [Myripristis murdjan]|uniref:uncharacterized protein il12rb1 n=1 Tax=Myripristis murdjan TaxID=586833 RepID=UPI001176492D|nr:uncharacterized protein LOC115357418 [Myripristis murdjan]